MTRFRPRLTLQTLSRGNGLLGLRPHGPFGPRSAPLTVAWVSWVYEDDSAGVDERNRGLPLWEAPAPHSVLEPRGPAELEVSDAAGRLITLARDFGAEADAMDKLRAAGLEPLDSAQLQWRDATARRALGLAPLWSLVQEAHFADLWADVLPTWQAQGWRVVVRPGFAHQSTPVQAWRLSLRRAPGHGDVHDSQVGSDRGGTVDAEPGLEPAEALQPRAATVQALRGPADVGAWLLSLGIEVDGELLDLAPMLATLLRHDARWRDVAKLEAIDPLARMSLRAPGGRRVDVPAAPLKAIVRALLDLLTDPQPAGGGPLRLSAWDEHRLFALQASLLDSQPERAGPSGQWALQGDAGLRALADRLRVAGEPAAVPAPAGLGVQLRAYQLSGLAWLQHLRAQGLGGILADDMGLGKTAQALAHLLIEQQAGRLDRPALVVVPSSLLFNWQSEAQRMAPALKVMAWQGPKRHETVPALAQHDLVLVTYALLWRDVEALAAQPWHLLLLDEAQTVKNAHTRAARAIRRLDARHRLCLTGTPLENHLGELWAQFDFLMPGFLGDWRSFTRRWRKPIEENGETLRAQLLRQRVRPFILRRRKDEVAPELPPRTEVVERVALQGRQRELYETVRIAADKQVRRALQRSGFAGAQIHVLDALLKLRQVCVDPRLLKQRRLPATLERAKLEWLRDRLPELVSEGRRVLVFSQFTEMLALLADELQAWPLPFLSLTGDTPSAQRGSVVQRFQAGEAPVFLLSLKAGGLGLNLTAADTVIHLDPWWNPAVQQQATDRAHRIGQDKPVFVYQLLVAGSIEERMVELQARKAALADGVLGEDGEASPKFSEADLDALLAPLV